MKAITTRYAGPTDAHPIGRIIASDQDGNRVTVPYDGTARQQDAHFQAARALADRMQWHGQLAGGAVRNGYVWVWVEQWSTYTIGYVDQSIRRAAARALEIDKRLTARRARRKDATA